MASFGQIIFYSMIILIVIFAALIILILSLALTSQPAEALSSNTKPIGNIGDDELLDCHLHSNIVGVDKFRQMSVTWEKKDLNGLVYLYEDGAPQLEDQASEFKGRTSLFPESISAGNASLLLRSVRGSDEGEYTCSISSSDGGGRINIYLRTAAFSAPTFTLSNGILSAVASRWFPKPNVTWLNQTGSILTGSTSFTQSPVGIFSVVSTLKPPHINETYSCRIENSLVIAVGEATVTDTGFSQRSYFSYNVAAFLPPSVYLNIVTSVFCLYYVT